MDLSAQRTSKHVAFHWFALKALHLACTIIYLLFALGLRFVFSAVDVAFGVELFDLQDVVYFVTGDTGFLLDAASFFSVALLFSIIS